ncbi:MAG: YceI family protein [Verrucomicrobia bacterium]|nr:YceI family protein [Verrucomicrobiota bacterium]
MKTNYLRFTRNFTAALLMLAAAVQAADNWTRYDAQPTGSKVKIEGTSTIHDWTMDGQIIGGYVELDPAFDASPKPGKVGARAQVMIPVRSLKSGKASMDSVMQQAMKQDVHPKIEYRLTEMSLKEAPKSPDGPYQFDTKGDLIVAGVTNKIAMLVTMERAEKTKLKFSGSTPIKMTDYGVTPPAPKIGLGLIKTGNDVKISFEWITSQRAATAK